MFKIVVGLLVVEDDKYAQYRTAIAPLLEAAGGRFRFDFEIARTLKREAEHDINRLFVLQFPDRAAKERFFADAQYREIRARLYESAVRSTTMIAECAG